MKKRTRPGFLRNDSRHPVERAAWLAIFSTTVAILLLVSLHVVSPEFSPPWRMVSEYAFGHYAWVLSLMFLSWGIGAWALVVALWREIQTNAGKVGLYFLVIAGAGEALASVFDITHEIGHGIAGLLGVLGFPIAALLVSVALSHNETWAVPRKALLWIANLNWISIVLLAATMALMIMQLSHANGGHLPRHAPKSLPPGVLGLDGWADRLIVLSNCAWVLVVAWHAIQLQRNDRKAAGARCHRFGTPKAGDLVRL